MDQDSNQPLYFHCSMCGECCSSWNIPVEGHKARALLERDWVKDRLLETRREIVKISDELYRLPLTDENVCVFLAEDRRCMVETHEGLPLKPHECQRFPFATVRMPDGTTRHDTSAACKQISEKLLLAFQPILPKPSEPEQPADRDAAKSIAELQAHEAAQFDDIEEFPAKVFSGLFRKVDVAAYERYLQSLHAIFSDPGQTSESALKQAQALLWRLPDSAELEAQPCRGNQKETFRCSRFRFSSWAVRMAIILFLRKPYRTMTWLSLLAGREYHDPRVFGLPVDLRAREAIPWDPALDHHVNAFLYNLLNRRLLIARGQSLSAMLAMAAAACLLVRWYATTLASIRGGSLVELSDVTGSIRLVERYYTGHQPRFLQFFNSRWKGWLFERFLLG